MPLAFAVKQIGLLGSQLKVYDSTVSFMDTTVNADVDSNNASFEALLLQNAHVDIESADFNLNEGAGVNAQRRVVSIAGTAAINYDLPRLLDEDLYYKKRSQIAEGGDDSADSGAIEVNYLNDRRSYSDPSDICAATLTPQGRSLMARSVMGLAAYQITGFSIGRGGYVYHNPVEVLPVTTRSDASRGWVEGLSNTWGVDSELQIQGHNPYITKFRPTSTGQTDSPTTHIYYFTVGTSLEETMQNLADKVNDNSEVMDTVYATLENIRVFLIAVPVGSIGDTIWYAAYGLNFISYYGVSPSSGFLIGGTDEDVDGVLIDPIFDATVDGGEIIAEWASENALALTMKLGPTEHNYAIGELAVIAEVKKSTFSGEVGTQFCFAIAHSPISTKHAQMVWVKRFIIIL